MEHSPHALRQLVEGLQTDLRSLSSESKKKFPAVKEAAERSMMNLRTLIVGKTQIVEALTQSDGVLHAFLFGCESRQPKLIQISLTAMQKLITHRAIPESSIGNIINSLWGLMESRLEELKILQTIMVLVSCLQCVHGEMLAKAFVICLRLHTSRDPIISNTASASVRQLVCIVFERVAVVKPGDGVRECVSPTKRLHKKSPRNLDAWTLDAYLLFQDLCHLMNGDNAVYLVGLSEIDRSLGLELLETVLTNYADVFLQHPEFSFLLKERICPLVIKLFSPSIKHQSSGTLGTVLMEKPSFSISLHLLRIVSVLIKEFFTLLITECEIFLSLLVKFLDSDKPFWQRTMAIEVLQSLCSRPILFSSFCQYYDMQEHSTKIFRDIIMTMGSFLQSLFAGPSPSSPTSAATSSVSSTSSTMSVGSTGAASGTTSIPSGAVLFSPTHGPRRGFISGSHFISSSDLLASRTLKPVILHMLDKTEPPVVQDSYALAVAVTGIQAVTGSIISLVCSQPTTTAAKSPAGAEEEIIRPPDGVLIEMVNSSWCGVLAALSLLLDASCDEQATEDVLKTLCSFLHISGALELATPRDAFITTLCKACLPPHYALAATLDNAYMSPRSKGGTPLSVSTNVVTTAAAAHLSQKNLQCMRSLLGVVQCHGGVLGSAWYLVLSTLQHLVDILNLKPTSSGSFNAAGVSDSGMSKVPVPSTFVDLSIVASVLSRLFEPSRFLSESALLTSLDALCRISNETLDSIGASKEPSLFAPAKLLEVGLSNMSRFELVWDIIESHFLKLCQHSNGALRDFASECLTSLVRSGLNYKNKEDGTRLDEQVMLQTLQKMSRTDNLDVRHQQLECVFQVLHSNGQEFVKGWSILFDILMQGAQLKDEAPVRVAFQALQLVVTDFMSLLPCSCLPLCIQTVARFGTQQVEVNISLTAIGLLWSVSDFLEQNRDAIDADADSPVDADPNWTGNHLSPFERLWLCLFGQLAMLCVDDRPPVRKSACQTLFQTINTYGHVLTQQAWEPVVWKVLFPMLKEVQARSGSAADTKLQTNEGGSTRILIHHSRDTEQKQWAETQKMALAGVARVFQERRAMLCNLDGFVRAWTCLLDVIYNCALYPIPEVSLAALMSFQVVVHDENFVYQNRESWRHAWQTWLAIGRQCLQEGDNRTQMYLKELVKVFRSMYCSLVDFSGDDLHALAVVLRAILSCPIDRDSSIFLTMSSRTPVPSPLQRACLEAIEDIYVSDFSGDSLVLSKQGQELAPRIIVILLEFSLFASRPGKRKDVGVLAADELNCTVAFGERAMRMACTLYLETKKDAAVIESFVLDRILKCVHVPLKLKYECPVQTTWQQAVDVLLQVVKSSLDVVSQPELKEAFLGMWNELGGMLEDFLFSPNLPKTALPVEQRLAHEELDIKVVEMLRTDILTRPQCLPPNFKNKVMELLHRGSEHSAEEEYEVGRPGSVLVRESFAKSCFETLLHVSFLSSDSNASKDGGVSELAITTLLSRCQDVLKKYVSEERLAGRRPLPRSQMSEVAFVLKASGTVLESLKKAHQANAGSVTVDVWKQVIEVYPCLVDCVTCVAADVKPALKDALRQFQQLLSPPAAFDVL